MNDTESRPITSQGLMILQGREAIQLAFSSRQEDKSGELLLDGEKRKYDRPKKQHFNHMIPSHFISPKVQIAF
ncbi:hypothetical protein AXY_01450 [Amphibacillus xylanus NBRC 15112]|uniref:Uncharacterized protein n=1 Tax=Amphibacillus xylanus (strain ATCC 51415 / DSM 6626 / JCM 7361 / LMG 17667 / NBRC 15112 / Ep01) TaxID=698758 RepID=K0IZ71_AMPXN|nr:hypothetical protein AXY_01450 [Amphibacillus xylanus NBRC 15112]